MNQPFPYRLLALAAVGLAAVGGVVVWKNQSAAVVSSTPTEPVSSPRQPSLPLDPVVMSIIRDSDQLSYLKLNYRIKDLSTDLAAQDVEALLSFITGPKPAGEFGDAEWGSLTNDIQQALTAQTVPNERVAQVLIAMHRDESRSQLMRDYALQHIGGFACYIVHTAATRQSAMPEFFPALLAELTAAAADGSKPWSGSAFNLLDRLLRDADYRGMPLQGLDPQALATQAAKVAADAKAPLNARLPALQFASRHQSPEAPVLARSILADASSNVMLIQSAAAVLAAHGSSSDLPVLQRLLAESSPHTRVALSQAIQKISHKN